MKILIRPKWVNGRFLSPKSTFLYFSLNLLIRFFWIFTFWQALISGLKWLYWYVKKFLIMPKNRENRSFLFYIILYFFEVVPDDRHKKVGKSDCFGIFRKFFIVSKNGGNGSSGRTRGPLLLCNNESVTFLDCTWIIWCCFYILLLVLFLLSLFSVNFYARLHTFFYSNLPANLTQEISNCA